MSEDPAVRRVTVGLIRSMNASVIDEAATDEELLGRFGHAAAPLAVALVETIRKETRDAYTRGAVDGMKHAREEQQK